MSRPESPVETNEVGAAEGEPRAVVLIRAYESPQEYLQPPPAETTSTESAENRQKRDVEAVSTTISSSEDSASETGTKVGKQFFL